VPKAAKENPLIALVSGATGRSNSIGETDTLEPSTVGIAKANETRYKNIKNDIKTNFH